MAAEGAPEKVLFLTNVGNRDVYLDGKCLGSNVRTEGERLLEEWKRLEQEDPSAGPAALAKRICLPILVPTLEWALDEQGRVDQLVLYATDQEEGTDPKLRGQDTLYLAKLMRRWLNRHLWKSQGKLGEVQVQVLRGLNPSLYDQAYACYAGKVRQQWRKEFGLCLVSLAGGTPACNTALLLQAIRTFGRRAQVVYTPKEGRPLRLRIAEELHRSLQDHALRAALDRCDFAAARALMEENGYDEAWLHLARYAEHRFAFDFDAARRALQRAHDACSREDLADLPSLVDRHQRHLKRLTDGDLQALTEELYHNACWTYRQGRYVDFLGRAFRFQENAARWSVEQAFGVEADEGDEEKKRAFKAWIDAHPHLRPWMEQQTLYGKPLRWDTINAAVLLALLRYLAEVNRREDGSVYVPAEEQGRYGQLHGLLSALDHLRALRNKSVIAHGFQGVSEEGLLEEYRQATGREDTPLDLMEEILRHLTGREAPLGPYKEVAGWLTERLA